MNSSRRQWINIPPALAFICLSMCGTPASAQTSLERIAGVGCLPIDKEKRSIYISYEGVGLETLDPMKRGQREVVRLRLHNNLTCGIRVPTVTPTETTLPDGETTTEVLPDNQRAAVIYHIQDYKQRKPPKAAPDSVGGDIIFWPILPPGKSITFPVRAEHFRKKLNVAVSFVYTWDGFSSRSLVHWVYFLRDSLPEQALEQSGALK